MDILVLCTGNQCRSPMAGALLRRYLAGAGVAASVASAGFVSEGVEAPPPVIEVMDGYGLDLRPHRSRLVTPAMLRGADLVVVMEHRHVREAVVIERGAFPRVFCLADLVRRVEASGPPDPTEAPSTWTTRLHHGRRHADELNSVEDDEIADPMGGTPEGYERAASELDGLTDRLATLLSGAAAPGDGTEGADPNGAT